MPLRLRLSLWYGSALALILVAFSTVLYFVTARSLRDALDQSLAETAAAAVRSLEERGFLPLIDEEELMDGAVIGEDSVVGAGALVTERTVVPPKSLVLGSPAKVRRPVTEQELSCQQAFRTKD